ncbi:MAG: addiction module protein [Stenomitos rutilans HA7619-LM2]|jgi:putative addiction module component (TIGR02574 family)|nr:addiction module protein [Stenomitos rutilans HA7619-LM2]
MTETAEKLKLELAQLSMEERAELAYFLIYSLDEESNYEVESAWNIELTEAQKREMDTRIEDYGINSDNTFTWEEVKASIKKP